MVLPPDILYTDIDHDADVMQLDSLVALGFIMVYCIVFFF